jgi:hypothetical protein
MSFLRRSRLRLDHVNHAGNSPEFGASFLPSTTRETIRASVADRRPTPLEVLGLVPAIAGVVVGSLWLIGVALAGGQLRTAHVSVAVGLSLVPLSTVFASGVGVVSAAFPVVLLILLTALGLFAYAHRTQVSLQKRLDELWPRELEALRNLRTTVDQMEGEPTRGEVQSMLVELRLIGVNPASGAERTAGRIVAAGLRKDAILSVIDRRADFIARRLGGGFGHAAPRRAAAATIVLIALSTLSEPIEVGPFLAVALAIPAAGALIWNLGPRAFAGLSLVSMPLALLVAAFLHPPPLPTATLYRDGHPAVRGPMIGQTGDWWYLVSPSSRIVGVRADSVRGVAIRGHSRVFSRPLIVRLWRSIT